MKGTEFLDVINLNISTKSSINYNRKQLLNLLTRILGVKLLINYQLNIMSQVEISKVESMKTKNQCSAKFSA